MNKLHCGPITPHNIINEPSYAIELEMKKPKPRLKPENVWIKELQEDGTIGLLFKLQHLENRRREIELYKLERSKMQNGSSVPGCRSGRHVMPRSSRHRQMKPEINIESQVEWSEEICEKCADEWRERMDKLEKNALINEGDISDKKTEKKHDFLRAHSVTGPPLNVNRYPAISKIDICSARATKLSVPTAQSASVVKLERRNINYIRANAFALQSDQYKTPRRSASAAPSPKKLEDYKKGEIPKYLKTMKAKESSKTKTASTSPAYNERLLTASEKRQLIDKLKSDLQDWHNELHRLPISMDTMRARFRKDEIERQIEEINRRIELFGKPNVYVEQ